jgi:hypothetical protein
MTAEDKPFQVRQTIETMPFDRSVSISGHDNAEDAKANCAQRNARAKELGLKARYEVVEK